MSDSNATSPPKSVAAMLIFPYKRPYLVIVLLLILISILELTFQTDDVTSNIWKITTNLRVTSITLILFLLAWLPFLIPWLYAVSPRISEALGWLRAQGVEEIETSIGRIKLNSAAVAYQENVLEPANSKLPPDQIEQQLKYGYQEAIKLTKESRLTSASDALTQIDDLAALYDRVRDEVASSSKRVRLMTDISAAMWSLMPQMESFPIKDRLLSSEGGKRLSAYKYLEWQPTPEFLDLLLSRAIGVLETPFGQYAALLALRRVLGQTQLTEEQNRMVQTMLRWYLALDYSGYDRRRLMQSILRTLG